MYKEFKTYNELISNHPEIVDLLLYDHTMRENIRLFTDSYSKLEDGSPRKDWQETDQLTSYKLDHYPLFIRARKDKALADQQKRTKDKAEVFTPSWVCNRMINMVYNSNFSNDYHLYTEEEVEQNGVFSKEITTELENGKNLHTWKVNLEPIRFNKDYTWETFVKAKDLEITCGEAPFVVSRYDTVDGRDIPIIERVGVLDRKLRVINENVKDEQEWLKWVRIAYTNVYGFEWQGDNLFIARQNLLLTFFEYYKDRWQKEFNDIDYIKDLCDIITWNFFQMDGLKCVIPMSCGPEKESPLKGFEKMKQYWACKACEEDVMEGIRHTAYDCWHKIDRKKYAQLLGHNGIPVIIKNWSDNSICYFAQCVYTKQESEQHLTNTNKGSSNKGSSNNKPLGKLIKAKEI